MLHIQIEGLTASYSYPFLKSGTQLTLPAPPFSSILGNLSACAGRQIGPDETLIGFEFRSTGKSIDLERTRRLQTDKKYGRLSENPERGIAKREFHVHPRLDLYLTALDLENNFNEPAAAPCLGRSQDLGWINFVKKVDLSPLDSGELGPTLVRFPNTQIGGLILPPLADFYINDRTGFVREAGRYTRYQFVRQGSAVRSTKTFSLYHPSDSESINHAVVLHSLRD
ncbi:MAG: CRISPR-associated protein Cas5 [Ktedonobacteraceae bacterium]